MAQSEIAICNMALALVGEDSIRSFDENNKRSRLSKLWYDQIRDYLLTTFDWNFARRVALLNQIDPDTLDIPLGCYAYQLPADCETPRDILPYGSRDSWELHGRVLFAYKTPVYLIYTSNTIPIIEFSAPFTDTLAKGIAASLCMPVRSDKTLFNTLNNLYLLAQDTNILQDANTSNIHRAHDNDPEQDSFVDPEKFTVPAGY